MFSERITAYVFLLVLKEARLQQQHLLLKRWTIPLHMFCLTRKNKHWSRSSKLTGSDLWFGNFVTWLLLFQPSVAGDSKTSSPLHLGDQTRVKGFEIEKIKLLNTRCPLSKPTTGVKPVPTPDSNWASAAAARNTVLLWSKLHYWNQTPQ